MDLHLTPEFIEAADQALATGTIVVLNGVAIVPDVVIVEEAANDDPPPITQMWTRSDGREVAIYTMPEGC